MENQDTVVNLEQKVVELEASLVACQTAMTEWKNKSLYVTADFENFKRRHEKERAQWMSTAQEQVLKDFISIADDFDRAIAEYAKYEPTPDMKIWAQGFIMIDKALRALLAKHDVREMTDYTEFNPTFHEAIMQVDSPNHESGAIVAVLQKGYLFKGAVLRPAQVSVAR